MAKKVDLLERLNMRFLTVAYSEKQETKYMVVRKKTS